MTLQVSIMEYGQSIASTYYIECNKSSMPWIQQLNPHEVKAWMAIHTKEVYVRVIMSPFHIQYILDNFC